MEDMVFGAGRFILRTLTWLLIEALIGTVIYWYGRLTLKLLTFGQYPPASDEAETRCILAGFVSIGVTLGLIVSVAA